MITLVATFKVHEGKGAKLEETFANLGKIVRATEPGCTLYMLNRSRTDANIYTAVEVYADDAALAHHNQTAHYLAAGPSFGECLNGPAKIEILDARA